TDCADNSVDYVHTVTIDYDELETPTATFADVACYDDIVLPTPPTVLDSCGESITPSDPVEGTVPDCEGDVTYTWTYTDCADNSVDYVHTVTIDYDELETPTATFADVACYDDIVLPTPPTVLDSCGESITPSDPVEGTVPDCEGDVTYTWTYTDCADNSVDYVHTVTIDYTQGITAPDDDEMDVQCPEDAVMPNAPENITDACGRTVEPFFSGREGNPDDIVCNGTVIYTWTYTACDGETTDTYTYTYNVKDTTDPEIQLPEYEDTVCEDEVPASLTATWTDNCADDEEITAFAELVGEDECSMTYRYYFEKADDCGNPASEEIFIVREIDLVGECETIFGYASEDISRCFLEDDFNRWGWTNELTAEGSYDLTLYAGAGQCDRTKGAVAGTATIDYSGGEVTVTYQMDGYTLSEAHVYIGCTPYPLKNGSPTVAPGQYNFNPRFSENVQAYQVGPVDVSDLDEVYVIVHGVACEIICQCTPDVNGEIQSSFDGAQAECDESDESETASNGNGNGKNNKVAEAGNFKASPVPFNERLTIQYDFEYTSKKVDIQVYDLSGRLLRTYSDKKVTGGDTKELEIDFALKANQVYLIRMVTDREVLTKSVISSSRK
ncbi:T9SS type A sorting domain-containing protein, partial [Christiangramia sabulilitoris]|uniref:T9SS type A sorting domain-containing protein n=1 Tax=Christiangramia sabulilitoris TaxID=2583991 RepID=UPI00140E63A7